MKIERRESLSVEEFTGSYLAQNRPVIVRDAILRWSGASIWNFEFFSSNFGRCDVQVYDDLFELQTICRLQTYLDSCIKARRKPDEIVPYVRWYARSQDLDFAWSDAAFTALAAHWQLPYFLPDTNYLLPRCNPPRTVTPVSDAFPAKGIFISAAGARTRQHVDPWCSDAVLCQLLGSKAVTLISPARDATDQHSAGVDLAKFEDVLSAGEVLFIPSGWPHTALTVTDSISVTWNFVHHAHSGGFTRCLQGPMHAEDRAILAYFGYGLAQRPVLQRR